MSDPIRAQLLSEINEALKWIRNMEDKCVFNHSLPLPSDGIEKIPHPEIVAGHTYIMEVVKPAAEHVTVKWLMISPIVRDQMREPVFRDTLKLFKAHYDAFLTAINSKPKPMLFDKTACSKVIRTAVRKLRAAEARKPKAPHPATPPKVRLMEGWEESCEVARFQRRLEDQDHDQRRKHRSPRNPSNRRNRNDGDSASSGSVHPPSPEGPLGQ